MYEFVPFSYFELYEDANSFVMQSIEASQDWFMQKFPTIFEDRLTWGLRFASSPEECSSSLKEAFEELTRTVGLPKEENVYFEGT